MNETYPIIPAHAGWYIASIEYDAHDKEPYTALKLAIIAWKIGPSGALPITELWSTQYNTYARPKDEEHWIIVDPAGRASHGGYSFDSLEDCIFATFPLPDEAIENKANEA
jgi:hypothetical protein